MDDGMMPRAWADVDVERGLLATFDAKGFLGACRVSREPAQAPRWLVLRERRFRSGMWSDSSDYEDDDPDDEARQAEAETGAKEEEEEMEERPPPGFCCVLADGSAPGGRVWAVRSHTYEIEAYDASGSLTDDEDDTKEVDDDGTKKKKKRRASAQVVARLGFPEDVRRAGMSIGGDQLALTRVGDWLVGGGRSDRLHAWSISRARARPAAAPVPPTKKKRTREGLTFFTQSAAADSAPPCHSFVVEDGWAVGDVQSLGLDAGMVVVGGSTGGVAPGFKRFHSLRVMDVAVGKVTSVLAGHSAGASLHRQWCANLVFSSQGSGLALVFDVGVGRPVVILPDVMTNMRNPLFGGASVGVLGVDVGGAAPVCFSWGNDECVRCWDLRATSRSHAWTASNGNPCVTKCAWDDESLSLVAATSNPHEVTSSRYGSSRYRYREEISEEEADAAEYGEWPRGAANKAGTFVYDLHMERAWLLWRGGLRAACCCEGCPLACPVS
jgi:hypothetical protein